MNSHSCPRIVASSLHPLGVDWLPCWGYRSGVPVESRAYLIVIRIPRSLVPHRELLSPIPSSYSITVLTSLIPYSASELILQITAIECIEVGEGWNSHRPVDLVAMFVKLGGSDWSKDNVRLRRPGQTAL